MTVIPNSCFKNCPALESVSVPSSITEIGQGAFRKCASLEAITLPASLQGVISEYYVFRESPVYTNRNITYV